MKRFWKKAVVSGTNGGFAVLLDERPLRTPRRRPLVAPGRALALAIAAEWEAQGEEVDPVGLPLTRAGNSAIDSVAEAPGRVAAALAEYGGTDLLCYRAPHPEELARLQAEQWDPLLQWSAEALDAPLRTGEGVMHVLQPEPSLARFRARVERFDPWELTAMNELVTLSGSLVLALAVERGRLAAEDAWRLSRLDEDWQIAEWGEDAEAAAAAAARQSEFMQADRLLKLLQAG